MSPGRALPPRISIVTPVFEQAAFLGRAVGSVLAQTVAAWELIVVDDGSERDDPAAALRPFLTDPRIRLHRLETNGGLGAACNAGLDLATSPLIAYLPADDRWDPWHLDLLLACLDDESVTLAWSGVRHNNGRVDLGPVPGSGLQLVQVAHRRTPDRWVERDDLESDDLERLHWAVLRRRGRAAGTGMVSCEWVDHPGQRSKTIRDSAGGGINVFRTRYRVRAPLRFSASDSWPVDEVDLYRRFRERPPTPPAADGLTILLTGELGLNPERVLALEERGHRLHGLWTDAPGGDNGVGPVPFGHVAEVKRDGWRDELRALRPDVIYGLLTWRAVPFAHQVLVEARKLGIPFVWHFKESPFRSVTAGTWPELAELAVGADAAVWSSPEERAWFELALPGRLDPSRSEVIDGDLPKAEWFAADPDPLLSSRDGELHTVALGRPLGLDVKVLVALAEAGIHTHLYGQPRQLDGGQSDWLQEARARVPGYVHLHPHVHADGWVHELSRYDAGWLHRMTSTNGGDLGQACWTDLDHPARIPPLVAAGVPLLQQASPGSTVAAQELVGRLGIGILFNDLDDLHDQLCDEAGMSARRAALAANRDRFTFDHHADRLLRLFRTVVG